MYSGIVEGLNLSACRCASHERKRKFSPLELRRTAFLSPKGPTAFVSGRVCCSHFTTKFDIRAAHRCENDDKVSVKQYIRLAVTVVDSGTPAAITPST